MKKILTTALTALAFLSVQAQGTAHFTGNITGQGDSPVMILRVGENGYITDTLRFDKKGNFDITVGVDHPTSAFFFVDEKKISKPLFIEDGINMDIQARVLKNSSKEEPWLFEAYITGDNADCAAYLDRHNIMHEYERWNWDLMKRYTFRQYRSDYLAYVDSLRLEVSQVKSLNFRRGMYEQIEKQINSDLARFGWQHPYVKDADFESWLLGQDHNDPEKEDEYNRYWRWYYEQHKLQPGETRYDQLKQAFTSQEIINRIADGLIIHHLQGAPENMDQLLAAYKATSTNAAGHQKAQEVYDHYKKCQKGMPAVDFTFSDKNGKEYHLSDFRGKALYIDVWATWCGPCCAEIPYMEKLTARYKGDKRISMISISFDDNKAKWLKKLANDKPDWPQYICPENFQSILCKEYDINGIPRFLLFDKDGNILDLDAPRPSSNDIDQWIEAQLK